MPTTSPDITPTPGPNPTAMQPMTFTTFTTNFPDVVGDTTVMPLLNA